MTKLFGFIVVKAFQFIESGNHIDLRRKQTVVPSTVNGRIPCGPLQSRRTFPHNSLNGLTFQYGAQLLGDKPSTRPP